jgi:hypothetical protein
MLRFQELKTNQVVEKVRWVESQPVGAISEGSPIEFFISGSSDDYLCLKKTLLHLKIKVLHADGTPLESQEKVGPINLMLHSLFSQVDVSLQNIQVSSGVGTNYPYKAYLDVLLNHGKGAKESWLQSQGYFKDRAGYMDDTNPLLGGNSGLVDRYLLIWTDPDQVPGICDLEGPLMADICQQDIPIPNGVDVRIRLWPSKSSFLLMSGETTPNYKVTITEACLKVCRIKTTPQMIARNEQHLAKTTAKYPLMKSEITTQTVAAGTSNLILDDIFRGRIPGYLILGMISAEAYNGNYTKNPYNFKNYKVNRIGTFVNGDAAPTEPLKLDFSGTGGHRLCQPGYATLFTEYFGEDRDNDIRRQDYPKGYTLYAFNFSGIASIDGATTLRQKGNLKVNIQFAEPLPETAVVLLYSATADYIQLDKARNVILG